MQKSNFYVGGAAAQTSNNSEWRTPKELFNQLDKEFEFTLDAAANHEDHLCNEYIPKQTDSLTVEWSGNVFINPPYDRNMKSWIRKCYEQSKKENVGVVVALIPARTDTSYWHDYIFGKAQIRYIKGRVKFWLPGQKSVACPFPSAVVIWKRAHHEE